MSYTIAGAEQGSVKDFYQVDHIKKTKNIESLDILLSYFCLLEKKSFDYCISLMYHNVKMGSSRPQFWPWH